MENELNCFDCYNPKYNQALQNPEELNHFKQIVSSFFNYSKDQFSELYKLQDNSNKLPAKHKLLLSPNYFENRIEMFKKAIQKNQMVLITFVNYYKEVIDWQQVKIQEQYIQMPLMNTDNMNISKLRSTLKQLIRDWSEEGRQEREQTYAPIITEFKKYFPSPYVSNKGLSKIRISNNNESDILQQYSELQTKEERIKVLFPGTGLGRIVFEFAKMGFAAQGNEFSYQMLLVSNYMLNMCSKVGEFEVQPFISTFTNLFDQEQCFKTYKIPDILTSKELENVEDLDFSMIAGDFVDIYKVQNEQWHSIVTCFFIDCAMNIIEYIETIHSALQKGGVWINFGPLLYHYSDSDQYMSIELPWDELKNVIQNIGFQIVKEEVKECQYASSEQRTMMKTIYSCILFTAIKIK